MSGITRNLAAANRERQRLQQRLVDDPFDISATMHLDDIHGNAFWGSLNDLKEAADEAGMGYRVNLGSIGRYADDTPDWMAARMRGYQPGDNQVLNEIGESQRMRSQAADEIQRRTLDARQRQLIADQQAGYDQQVAASLNAPPIAPHTITQDGNKYTIRETGTPDEQLLARMPAPAAAAYRLQLRQQAEAERRNKAAEELQGGALLSDDAITQTAKRYLETGVMPPLGMGDKTTRQRVLNKAAELGGANANVAGNTAAFKADSGSLSALQKQRDAVGAFEETALKNLDNFLDLARKVPDTGSPAMNTPLRAISERGMGSAELAAYNAARRTVIPEFAKILSNPNASGQLSDSARHEVEEVLNGNATLGQTLAVADLLKRDAANRRQSFDDQIKEVKGRIGSNTQEPKAKGTSSRVDELLKKYGG